MEFEIHVNTYRFLLACVQCLAIWLCVYSNCAGQEQNSALIKIHNDEIVGEAEINELISAVKDAIEDPDARVQLLRTFDLLRSDLVLLRSGEMEWGPIKRHLQSPIRRIFAKASLENGEYEYCVELVFAPSDISDVTPPIEQREIDECWIWRRKVGGGAGNALETVFVKTIEKPDPGASSSSKIGLWTILFVVGLASCLVVFLVVARFRRKVTKGGEKADIEFV